MNLRVLIPAYLAAATLLLSGCVERTDALPRVAGELAELAYDWELAGEIGGTAEVSTNSDPFERRAEAGKFLRVSGVDTWGDEVWTTDMLVSRVQVFGLDGRLRRTFGNGIIFDEQTIPSDIELQAEIGAPDDHIPWRETPAAWRWLDKRNYFRAADIVVLEDGYLLADWTRNAFGLPATREPGVLRYDRDGEYIESDPNLKPNWPTYIDFADGILAQTESLRNTVWITESPPGKLPMRYMGAGAAIGAERMVEIMRYASGDQRYPALLIQEMRASGDPGLFYHPGGVAIAFDKLVVCDTGNRRLQIFDASRGDAFYWGKLVRIIYSRNGDNNLRFEEPRDIAISAEGRVYVLDTGRMEVVELSPKFERLGVVARNLGDPYAIAVSDDGRHVFISERSDNRVLHYTRTESSD